MKIIGSHCEERSNPLTNLAMIFISHNHRDKIIIEPIAIKLSKIFGIEKVFYDSWSIQPGDGIIDRMNSGLENCKYFFFFVSKNSLGSNMVKMEWQNALYKATQNKIKLIPVKLDDCLMPAVLTQTLYIDIFGKGFEYGLRQIIDTINNQNTYNIQNQTYENVRGYIYEANPGKEFTIEIKAETYIEPVSKYILLTNNSVDEIECDCTNHILLSPKKFINDVPNIDNTTCSGFYFDILKPTTPGFPIRFKLSSKNGNPIKLLGIARAVSENSIRNIPLIYK